MIHLFTEMFWGIYFVIVGSIALIISFANLRISLFRVALGVLLIYAGAVALFGVQPDAGQDAVLMARVTADLRASGEHSIVFGEGVFNIERPQEGENLSFEFSSVFGSTTVFIPRDVPVRVQASAVFGSVETPDGMSTSFGEHTYTLPGSGEEEGSIFIEANAVFGSVRVIRR